MLSDGDLAGAGVSNLTFAQPFNLDLGHGSTIPAAAVDSSLSAHFTQYPGDPVLAAEQLLAWLSFVHFENAFVTEHRGVVIVAAGELAALGELHGHAPRRPAEQPVAQAVTLSQLFAQVPVGGNGEPSVRRLQSGPAGQGIARERRRQDRAGAPAARLVHQRGQLGTHPRWRRSATPSSRPKRAGSQRTRRAAALDAYDKAFAGETDKITLATERTVTFTAQRAAIPVTVLSAAPYPVTVVVTLASDKFTFPDGNTRQLVLDRPTTSVRVTAQARTSGDHLPIERDPANPERPAHLGPHRAHRAFDRHLLRRRRPHRVGRGRALGLVDTDLAPVAAPAPEGPALTVAPPRRARTLPLRTSAVYVAAGTGCLARHGAAPLRRAGLGPRADAAGRLLQPGQHHAQHALRRRLGRRALRHVHSRSSSTDWRTRTSARPSSRSRPSITVSVVVLLTTTLAALVAAPYLVDALTALDTHAHSGQLQQVDVERHVATTFLRWFVIQIAAYGLFALGAALLNTRRRFVAVAWAPIVNNLVCIGILIWFGLWAGHGASLASVEAHRTQLVLLGLGTSLGVVFQGVALIPSLRNADLRLVRWHWNPHDDALRAVARLGGWTFGFVLANQAALFVVTILAGSVAGSDPVSSYTYAYAFFQLPYGIVAVTVMSVVTPDLSEKWSTGQQAAFLHRMAGGLRAVLALIIPSAVGMLLLGQADRRLVARHRSQHSGGNGDHRRSAGHVRPRAARLLRIPLLRARPAVDAAHQGGLLLVPRRERAQRRPGSRRSCTPSGSAAWHSASPSRTPSPPCSALAVFHQWFGRLADPATWAPLWRVVIASVPMAVVVLVVSNLSGSTTTAGLAARVVGARGRGRAHLRRGRRPPGAAPRRPSASPDTTRSPRTTGTVGAAGPRGPAESGPLGSPRGA